MTDRMGMDRANDPRADRLRRFFGEWRAIRSEQPLELLAERLGLLFGSLRTLSAPGAATQGMGASPVEGLRSVLDALREPLAEARSLGAFLNAWTAAGLRRDEVRNAAVLASLLDPGLCPATGPVFLREILSAAGGGGEHVPYETLVGDGYTVRTEDCPLGGGENRVDVTIEGRDFLLFIEVKIDAREGVQQLERYDGVLRDKARLLGKTPALVYLSPRPPANLPSGALHLTWLDVSSAARKASKPARGSRQSVAEALLAQFSVHSARLAGRPHGATRTRPAPDRQHRRPRGGLAAPGDRADACGRTRDE